MVQKANHEWDFGLGQSFLFGRFWPSDVEQWAADGPDPPKAGPSASELRNVAAPERGKAPKRFKKRRSKIIYLFNLAF